MKRSEVLDYIKKNHKGRCFGLAFVKADGTIRRMNARKKHVASLKGGEYKGKNPDVMPVYDNNNKAWRSFDVNRLLELHMNGKKFRWKPESD
jgi:hypothetical protein